VIDVGAAADAFVTKLGSSSVTVVDVRAGTTAYKMDSSPRILDAGWGEGDRLYFSSVDHGNLAEIRSFITEVKISTQTRREIFTADTMIQPLRTVVSPDGKRLVTAYNFDHPEQDNFKSLVSIDLGTLARKRVSGDHRVTSSYQWTADGKSIVYGERWNGLTQISRVDLDGKRVRITDDLRNNGDIRLAPDSSQIAYVARDGYGGQQVRLRSLRSNQERVLLDAVNYRDRFTLGSFEIAHWTDRDGLALHGYLFKPPNFDPAKKYPVIVDIHGGGIGSALLLIGPLWITTFRGPLEWHAWAALGYVVLVPEMRSSGEYTEPASIVDTVRDEGGLRGDMQDIASATDWILGQPYIDAKRAALFGLSAGGGRVNKFLTIDHRYAAGIILDPVRSGPLETIIVQALPPYTGVKIGPQPCLDAIAAGRTDFCEPGFLFDGRNSTTPTLIFVGNAEMGAVLGFSMDVLFTTLRKNNVPARMLRYMAEGHGSGSGASAMHKTEEMKKWLETYLKPR
jgi:dienelactone hydrolase